MHNHFIVYGENLPDAYHQALCLLNSDGEVVPCPDYETTIKEIGLTMFVDNATAEPFISRLFPGGHYELQQYIMEVVDGILDFKIGDGTCWEYTYHDRYVRQLPFIYEELKRNPYSRRAIMNIRDFDVDTHNDHPACLQSIQFMVREGDDINRKLKLHMKVMMRSNDAVQATFMNAVAFISLLKKVADDLGYEVGSYTHTAHSFHAYERNWAQLEKYVRDIEDEEKDITFNYEKMNEDLGCTYKEMMEESIPKIMTQVQKLKDNIK